jgi:hypothetical protein
MLSAAQREHLGTYVRTMQIIVFALAFGVVSFMAVAIVVRPGPPAAGQERQLLLCYISIVFTFAILAAWMVVPRLIATQWRRSIAAGSNPFNTPVRAGEMLSEEQRPLHPLVEMYQTRMIISCALLEGAAFFNVVAYFIERQPWNLWIALVLVLMILAHFPTTLRLTSWVEDELAEIARMQSMGGM